MQQHQPKENLETYLNDHLAGSISAINLITDLLTCQRSNGLNPVLEQLLRELTSEQDMLRKIMQHFDLKESPTKKLLGWLSERFAALKLISPGGEDPLRMMQALEMLQIGITGKRQEWLALHTTIAQSVATLGIDFPTLVAQAERQRDDLEHFRLQYAVGAFDPAPTS